MRESVMWRRADAAVRASRSQAPGRQRPRAAPQPAEGRSFPADTARGSLAGMSCPRQPGDMI